MSHDASPPPNPALDASPRRPLWPTLTRWWSAAADTPDPALGYESAHPWALDAEAPANGRAEPY